MKNKQYILLAIASFFFLLLTSGKAFTQTDAKVENIDFYAVGTNITITYDLVKAKTGEYFEVWVKIITDSGKEIIPIAMTGDVGKNVPGGLNKRIIWDTESDNAAIDGEISVEVFIKSLGAPAESKITEPSKEIPKSKEPKVKKNVSVGKAIFLSAILPGLGNRYAKGSGAQWLIGIAGYGLVAGSVVLNRSAYNAYEDYKMASTSSERDDLFSSAESKKSTSTILGGTALVVWVADLVWTGIQAGNANKKASYSSVSLHYNFDPLTGNPMIGLNYRF